MALPTNKIKKVKLPNNTEYDIVPTMLQDGTTNNKLSVPTLTSDNDEVVTTKTNQTITNTKTFQNPLYVNGNIHTNNGSLSLIVTDTDDTQNEVYALTLQANWDDYNSYIGTSATAQGNIVIFGDNDSDDSRKPNDETTSDDLDTTIYNTGVYLHGDDNYKISFPAKNGVFAVTSDLTEIVDLTRIS